MHVIIIGGGEVGQYLAEILTEERQDVYLIERNEERARQLDEQLDAQVLHGTGISRKLLMRAGVDKADLLLAVTETDEVNLVAAMTAERIHPGCLSVARVRNPQFFSGDALGGADQYGVDYLLGPDEAVAQQVIRLIQYVGPGQISPLAEGRAALLDLPVAPHSTLPYVTCGELSEALPKTANVAAVLGESGLRLTTVETRLSVGERAFVLCAAADVNEVVTLLGAAPQRVKRVLLIGGGTIGFHVGRALEKLGFDVTLVEKSAQRAEEIAVRLRRSVVIHADGGNPAVISQRMEERPDAVIVLTGDDSSAVMTGIIAKHFGAKRIVVRVDNPAYSPIAQKLGFDALISPRRAIADAILQFIRRSQVSSTIMLGNHEGEVIDFQVDATKNRALLETPVAGLKLPEGCKAALIARDGEVIVPRPDEDVRLTAGDHVFMVALREAVPRLDELFG